MKTRLILILLSNRFMLFIADILKFFKCKKLVSIILSQCNVNINYIESELGGNNNE